MNISNPTFLRRPIATAKMVVGAGEAKPGPPVGPVLAQFQLNIAQLCRELNEQTLKIFNQGVPLSIKVDIFDDKSYRIRVSPPALSFYFSQLGILSPIAKPLTVNQFYDIFFIFCQDKGLVFSNHVLREVFGFLRSTGLKGIILLFFLVL